VQSFTSLSEALDGADVVVTDAVGHLGSAFVPFRITEDSLKVCAPGVLINPCPPFTRAAEIDASVIDSRAFVGHSFKASLVAVQRAILGAVVRS
jgi:ornithine carbamoyltransferase